MAHSTSMKHVGSSFVNSNYQLHPRRAAFSHGSWISAGRRRRGNNHGHLSRRIMMGKEDMAGFLNDSSRNLLPQTLAVKRTQGLSDGRSTNENPEYGKLSKVVSSQKGYVSRIKKAGLQRRWHEVQNLLSEMRLRGVPRNLFVYNAAISALGRCGRDADAEALLSIMAETDNLVPDAFSFNTSISAYARRGKLEACQRILRRMQESGVKPDQYTFNTMADAAAKLGDSTAAANIMAMMAEEGVAPDLVTFNSCLAACGRKGDLRRAKALLELMHEDDLAPDQRSYCAIISAAGRQGEWSEALRFLEEMKVAGVEPDLITFNTAISAVGASGQCDLALGLLEEMKTAGLKPDTFTYTALMGAFSRAGEWQLVLQLLEDMRAAGVSPNTFSYSTAMDACGKAGKQEEALQLLSEMLRGGIAPDTVVYNSAIDACSVNGDWSTALRLLGEMKQGVGGAAPPDVVSYGGAITACARAGRAHQALQLMAELRANQALAVEGALRGKDEDAPVRREKGRRGRAAGASLPVPNLITYSATLYACLKAGEVHRGGEVLEDMIAAGFQPNSIHCDTMIAAWSAAGDPERAFSAMKRLQSLGFRPSLSTYESLVWGFAQVADWEATIRLLAVILQAGLKPSTRSWDAAIAACSQAGHWERALSLLANMSRQGILPSRVTYTAAVAGLNRPRHPEWGEKLEKLACLLQGRTRAPGDIRSNVRTDDTADEGAPEQRTAEVGGGRVHRQEAPEGLNRRAKEEIWGDANGPFSSFIHGSVRALECSKESEDVGVTGASAELMGVLRKEGFHPSTRAYRSVIYACARVGLLAEAVALAKGMERERKSGLYVGGPASPGTSQEPCGDTRVFPRRESPSTSDDQKEAEEGVKADGEAERDAARPSASVEIPETSTPLGDVEEALDMSAVYNSIVCNFARAATRDASHRQNHGASDDLPSELGQEASWISPGSRINGGKDDELMPLLLELVGLSEKSLSDEGASGGVEMVEDLSSMSLADAAETGMGGGVEMSPGVNVSITVSSEDVTTGIK